MGSAITTVDERSNRGPVVGIPMTWLEHRLLSEWVRLRPPMRAMAEGAMVIVDLRRQDAEDMARALAGDLPSVAATFAAALEEPTSLASLTQEERIVVQRLRRVTKGTVVVSVEDGIPTVAPTRHWRWHSGGVEGYRQSQLGEAVAMSLDEVRRHRVSVDWQMVMSALDEVGRGAAQVADAVRRLQPQLGILQQAWDNAQAGEEALARLDVIRRVLAQPVVPGDEHAVGRGGAGHTTATLPTRKGARDRILASLPAVVGNDGTFDQRDLLRTVPVPRTTLLTALSRLAQAGILAKTDRPGVWRVLAPPAPDSGPTDDEAEG